MHSDRPSLRRYLPFMQWWHRVNAQSLRADSLAGFTGALIVLPQGVAFATIAGLPPEYGLYAAMLPAVIAALFGSSWHLVSGPTTAISIAVYASISGFATPGTGEYISMVLTLTFLTGLFQLMLGLARMGVLVNFISHTVVIGFTAGAAVLIATSQIKHFFGLDIPRGSAFHETLHQLWVHIGDINPYITTVGIITLLSGVIIRALAPKLPYMIFAMLVGSLAAYFINQHFGSEVTHISTVGALSTSLPPISIPDFSFDTIQQLFFPALVITMLALTEAVSISRAIALKSGQKIDSDQEFIGQGLSNLAGSFFSSYASSGSFNRSGVNYVSGAITPLASVFAAVILLIVLLLVAPLAAYLPTAAMAGILFLVAWSLIDIHHIAETLKVSRTESMVLLTTLVGTLVDLEKGIFVGIILSLMAYLYRTSRPGIDEVLPDPEPDSYHYVSAGERPECPQVKLLRLNGSIFFGAVSHVQSTFESYTDNESQPKHLVIMASGINFVDIAGADMLGNEAKRLKDKGGGLYLYRPKDTVIHILERTGNLDVIGHDHLFSAKSRPITAIYPTLDSEICRHCPHRVFHLCHLKLPNGEPRTYSPECVYFADMI